MNRYGGLEFMLHKGALVDVILGAEYQYICAPRPPSKTAFTDTTFVGAPFSFDHDAVVDIVRARLTQGYGWWGPM